MRSRMNLERGLIGRLQRWRRCSLQHSLQVQVVGYREVLKAAGMNEWQVLNLAHTIDIPFGCCSVTLMGSSGGKKG